MKTIKKEELPALTDKVVDALGRDALACGVEIGIHRLMDDGDMRCL